MVDEKRREFTSSVIDDLDVLKSESIDTKYGSRLNSDNAMRLLDEQAEAKKKLNFAKRSCSKWKKTFAVKKRMRRRRNRQETEEKGGVYRHNT